MSFFSQVFICYFGTRELTASYIDCIIGVDGVNTHVIRFNIIILKYILWNNKNTICTIDDDAPGGKYN